MVVALATVVWWRATKKTPSSRANVTATGKTRRSTAQVMRRPLAWRTAQ